MRTNKTKRIILTVLALILAFAFTACANVDPSADGSDVETITVKMNIIFSDGAEQVNDSENTEEPALPDNIEKYKMQVEKTATVMDVTKSFANQQNLELVMDEDTYITSIDGVEADDSSGWVYSVNGNEEITEAASDYELKDNDEIVWKFIKF